MYHSITFKNIKNNELKNTWDDWHLVPTSRPVFNPPKLKTKTIDIPGRDGVIDLTETLTGYPVYENRVGSQEFIVVNEFYEPVDTHKEWYDIYSTIMDYLHGQKLQATLEDDKEYYFEGRFEVNQWKSDKNYSSIVIDYDVGPYKWLYKTSIENDWLWDIFNFETGIIYGSQFKDIEVSNEQGKVKKIYKKDLLGRAPVCPSFSVSINWGGIYVRIKDRRSGKIISSALIRDRETVQVPEFVLFGDEIELEFEASLAGGVGTISVEFRPGRL